MGKINPIQAIPVNNGSANALFLESLRGLSTALNPLQEAIKEAHARSREDATGILQQFINTHDPNDPDFQEGLNELRNSFVFASPNERLVGDSIFNRLTQQNEMAYKQSQTDNTNLLTDLERQYGGKQREANINLTGAQTRSYLANADHTNIQADILGKTGLEQARQNIAETASRVAANYANATYTSGPQTAEAYSRVGENKARTTGINIDNFYKPQLKDNEVRQGTANINQTVANTDKIRADTRMTDAATIAQKQQNFLDSIFGVRDRKLAQQQSATNIELTGAQIRATDAGTTLTTAQAENQQILNKYADTFQKQLLNLNDADLEGKKIANESAKYALVLDKQFSAQERQAILDHTRQSTQHLLAQTGYQEHVLRIAKQFDEQDRQLAQDLASAQIIAQLATGRLTNATASVTEQTGIEKAQAEIDNIQENTKKIIQDIKNSTNLTNAQVEGLMVGTYYQYLQAKGLEIENLYKGPKLKASIDQVNAEIQLTEARATQQKLESEGYPTKLQAEVNSLNAGANLHDVTADAAKINNLTLGQKNQAEIKNINARTLQVQKDTEETSLDRASNRKLLEANAQAVLIGAAKDQHDLQETIKYQENYATYTPAILYLLSGQGSAKDKFNLISNISERSPRLAKTLVDTLQSANKEQRERLAMGVQILEALQKEARDTNTSLEKVLTTFIQNNPDYKEIVFSAARFTELSQADRRADLEADPYFQQGREAAQRLYQFVQGVTQGLGTSFKDNKLTGTIADPIQKGEHGNKGTDDQRALIYNVRKNSRWTTGKVKPKTTLGEVMQRQSNHSINAFGINQINPVTLKDIRDRLNLPSTLDFSKPKTQSIAYHFGITYTDDHGKYIRGEINDVEKAMVRLAARHSPIALKDGKSFWAHRGEKAKVGYEEAKQALINSRNYYKEFKAQGFGEFQSFMAATTGDISYLQENAPKWLNKKYSSVIPKELSQPNKAKPSPSKDAANLYRVFTNDGHFPSKEEINKDPTLVMPSDVAAITRKGKNYHITMMNGNKKKLTHEQLVQELTGNPEPLFKVPDSSSNGLPIDISSTVRNYDKANKQTQLQIKAATTPEPVKIDEVVSRGSQQFVLKELNLTSNDMDYKLDKDKKAEVIVAAQELDRHARNFYLRTTKDRSNNAPLQNFLNIYQNTDKTKSEKYLNIYKIDRTPAADKFIQMVSDNSLANYVTEATDQYQILGFVNVERISNKNRYQDGKTDIPTSKVRDIIIDLNNDYNNEKSAGKEPNLEQLVKNAVDKYVLKPRRDEYEAKVLTPIRTRLDNIRIKDLKDSTTIKGRK